MTSFLTAAGSAHVLAVLFGRTELASVDYFIGLCRTFPSIGDNGATIDEPDPSAGYARVGLPNFASSWTMSGYTEALNAVELVWPIVTGDWGNLTSFAVLDGAGPNNGRLLFFGTLTPPMQPTMLSQLRVRVGQLMISASSLTPSYQPT